MRTGRAIIAVGCLLVLIAAAVGNQWMGRSSSPSKPSAKVPPAVVTAGGGTNLSRVTLLPEAVRRLDIQKAPVREETLELKRRVGGEVISAGPASAIVRVELTENELNEVRREEAAWVVPLDRDGKGGGTRALPVSGAIAQTLSLDSRVRRNKAQPLKKAAESGLYSVPGTIHYEVAAAGHGLVGRQLVFVELTLEGDGRVRRIVPHGAVLYDAHGGAWVYTSPEPLVFVRQPIRIETIVGSRVVLADGPPAGTEVVTVGGAELWGAEVGVGK